MENQKQDSWDKNFHECLGFLILYNRYPTLSEKNIQHVKIAKWIKYQKLKYKNNKLEKEKLEKLEKLADWKWAKQKKKNINIQQLSGEDVDDPIIDDEPDKRKTHYTEYYDPIEEFSD
jgi:hypothetical protein